MSQAPKEPTPRPRSAGSLSLLLTASFALIPCLLLAAACGARVTSGGDSAGEGARGPQLSAQDRSEIFEGVWRAINEGYYDPSFNGADWAAVRERYRPRFESAASDREFYGLFEIMLSELRDSHTVFIPPPPSGFQGGGGPRSIGLSLAEAEGEAAVFNVEPGSEAERAGVRAGMVLRAVNGKPVAEHFAFLRSVFAGASSERDLKAKMLTGLLYGGFLETPRRLVFADEGGRELEVVLSPQPFEPRPNLSARRLASGPGYIHFGSWSPPVEQEFRRELVAMWDAPGLVIDLRGNGGGETRVLLDIAGNFFPRETFYGGFRGRDGGLKKYSTHRQERVYEGRVAVLLDERSASASESFSVFMQEAGRARVFGRRSAGSTHNLAGGERHFKGGGKLLFSTSAYVSPRGRDPLGEGVIPDEEVPLRLSDLRAGRDAALEVAERWAAGR